MVEKTEVTLPAYYATAFINGDYTGIETDAEVAHVEKIVNDLAKDGWEIVDVARDDDGDGKEPRFTWNYRMYNGFGDARGGDVLDYVVLKHS